MLAKCTTTGIFTTSQPFLWLIATESKKRKHQSNEGCVEENTLFKSEVRGQNGQNRWRPQKGNINSIIGGNNQGLQKSSSDPSTNAVEALSLNVLRARLSLMRSLQRAANSDMASFHSILGLFKGKNCWITFMNGDEIY